MECVVCFYGRFPALPKAEDQVDPFVQVLADVIRLKREAMFRNEVCGRRCPGRKLDIRVGKAEIEAILVQRKNRAV
jgi:hypothetical protein